VYANENISDTQHITDTLSGPVTIPYTITVDLVDEEGTYAPAGTKSVMVNNVAPFNVTIQHDPQTEENTLLTLSGSFEDPGVEDNHTVKVQWGDGSSSTIVELVEGEREFETEHRYLDDNPSGTPFDVYDIYVTVTDDAGGSGSASSSVTVLNVSPVLSIDHITDQTGAEIGSDIPFALVGLTVNVAASFADVGVLDTHTAYMNWGDSTADDLGTVVGAINASHVYTASGLYTLALTVTDDDTGEDTETSEIEVFDPAGSISEIADLLADLAGDPSLHPKAAKAIYKAIDKLIGTEGGLDDNGALDMLQQDNLNAALEMMKQAIQELEEAESFDADLDLTYIKGLLALSAKAVTVQAIAQAEAVATKPGDQRKIQQAKDLMAEGDTLLAGGDYVGAVDNYQQAVRKVDGIR
jgi:hypothetical protein